MIHDIFGYKNDKFISKILIYTYDPMKIFNVSSKNVIKFLTNKKFYY